MKKSLRNKDEESQENRVHCQHEEWDEICAPHPQAKKHAAQKTDCGNDQDAIEIPLLLWVGKEVLDWKRVEPWNQGKQATMPIEHLVSTDKYTAADKRQKQ